MKISEVLEGACERLENEGLTASFERTAVHDAESRERRLAIAINALKMISQIPESDCAKYVAIADMIAFEALAELES